MSGHRWLCCGWESSANRASGPRHEKHDWSRLGRGDGPVWVVRPSTAVRGRRRTWPRTYTYTHTSTHTQRQADGLYVNVQHQCDILQYLQWITVFFSLVLEWVHCLVVSKMSIKTLSYKHSAGIQIEVYAFFCLNASQTQLWFVTTIWFSLDAASALMWAKTIEKTLKWIILIDGAEITEKSVVLVTSAVHCGLSVKFYFTHFACDSCNDKSTVTHLRWICFAE